MKLTSTSDRKVFTGQNMKEISESVFSPTFSLLLSYCSALFGILSSATNSLVI